jgi:choline kinase
MKYDNNRAPMAIILADGIGSRLGPLTDKCARSLLSVGGSVILERMIRNCLSCGISQFVLVLGHREDEIKQFVDKFFRGIRVTYVINDRYRETDTGYSLVRASTAVGAAEFIKFDANVVFDTKILRALVDSNLPNVVCVDRNVTLADDDVKVIADDQMRIGEIAKSVDRGVALGKVIGIEKISAATGRLLFSALEGMMESAVSAQDHCEAAYARLVEQGVPMHALDITGMKWIKIDTAEDFAAANALFGSPITTVSREQQRALDEASAHPQRAS